MAVTASLTFLGAAGTVTGSRFLLEQDGTRVLVDCGLFQGLRELRRRNWEPPPVDPGHLDAVVLTHAHLDHCGYLPRLVRDGFAGPVYASAATCDLTAVVLRDSARLQEEDARYAAEHGFSKHARPEPLYGVEEAEAAITQLRPLPFGCASEVASGATLTLSPAGHILGSSVVHLVLDGRTVAFSGDLGRPHHPLLRAPGPPPEADCYVVESTYGDRAHAEPTPRLADAVRRTVARGGVVLVPAFAVDRTEVLLMELRRLMGSGEVPRVPVYVDSPMALETLSLYRRAIREASPEIRPDLPDGVDLFDPGHLVEARSVEDSKRLNDPGHPCVIVSASGMATGGRVVHHLAGLLPDPRNTVVLVGFQAAGTRGRDLAQGATQLKIHGRYVRVRAQVVECQEFSVHADADETLEWLRSAPREPDAAFVVHGEEAASAALAERIRTELGWVAVVPRMGERIRLG
ncbi:MAG: MBL fold metallo-hydrolase [Actinomycetia bacterium]|jgi:metallo-beta-lactamase family protein|nr:MBL fold metallo-hydrolase [Actinomycetes bacterium]